jgi:superoxide dismutase, Fe-Mn family
MEARTQALPFDPASLRGLSPALMESHHRNNYGGAVRRLNAIRAELAASNIPQLPVFTLNGLKREELIALNSMLLHELYFASLGGDGNVMEPPCALALAASFGSVQQWRDEFAAMGRALAGGSGWVLLLYVPREGRLINQWAADHTQVVAGGVPILALDMYEHAYHMDFGAAAGEYVEAFLKNLDWAAVHGRFRRAVEAASEPHGASAEDAAAALVIDVRRAGAYDSATSTLPGAGWRDPARVDAWAGELPAGAQVLVYCVLGHEVSRMTALRLRAAGVQARFLRGGIEGWRAAGHPVDTKAAAS